VDTQTLARGTPGFTGADLENMVNEAALMAAGAARIGEMNDFEDARTRSSWDRAQEHDHQREEKKTTAYHESGHTLVAKMLPNTDRFTRSPSSRGVAR